MCGIVGFTGKPDQKKLEVMLAAVEHRGPDDQAVLTDKACSLGMRRLAIIDLSKNIYPIADTGGQIQAVFNGEIYNYKELREELKAKGYAFKTESDSEVIVQGFAEWDVDVAKHLRGMFTIALLDNREGAGRLVLMRDRLGIKPLYYSEFEGRLIFGSEIKALLAAWDIECTPDDGVVYKFLLTRVHDDGRDTFLENIKRLPPAHYLEVMPDGNYRLERYWFPSTTTEFKASRPEQEYAHELREKLIETMRLHLISDVPLGVNLSGGLDSSAVTCLANKLLHDGVDLHTKNKLYTFSAIHPGETIDESEYIDEVLKFTGAESFKIIPKLDEFWNEVDEWMYYQEEPTISSAPYAYYTVMREAKKHVTVLLSGQGGDELFAGYIPYFQTYINTAQQAGAYWDIMRESIKGFDLYAPFIKERLRQILKRKAQLNVRDVLNLDNYDPAKVDSFGALRRGNLNARLFMDLTATTVPSLLRYEDKNSMAHSLESRVPFLDHELVEYVFSLPAELKIKHGWNRYIYRQAMKGLMPEKIRNRRSKIGFVNSEWEWLQAEAERIKGIFNSESFRSRKYWDADKVLAEFELWITGQKQGDGLLFWRILSTELWMRGYVDEFKLRTK